MSIFMSCKSIFALSLSAVLFTGVIANAEDGFAWQRQGDTRKSPRRLTKEARQERLAQITSQRQKIARLRQTIEQDRQKVQELRRRLSRVNERIDNRRDSNSIGQTAGQTKHAKHAKHAKRRRKMAQLSQELRQAVEAHDDERAAALRRQLQKYKAANGKQRQTQQPGFGRRLEMIRRIEQKIQTAQQTGQHQYAEALKNQLRKLKASNSGGPGAERDFTTRQARERRHQQRQRAMDQPSGLVQPAGDGVDYQPSNTIPRNHLIERRTRSERQQRQRQPIRRDFEDRREKDR